MISQVLCVAPSQPSVKAMRPDRKPRSADQERGNFIPFMPTIPFSTPTASLQSLALKNSQEALTKLKVRIQAKKVFILTFSFLQRWYTTIATP